MHKKQAKQENTSHSTESQAAPSPQTSNPSRRTFLRNTALGLAGGGAALAAGCEYKTQLFLLSSVEEEAAQKNPDWRKATSVNIAH